MAKFLPLCLASVLGWCAAAALPASASRLYELKTRCTEAGKAVDCTVEAIDSSQFTLYRHRIDGKEVFSVRLADKPDQRAQVWDVARKGWVPLERVSLNFTANELCFDGDRLCVINPNFFDSIRPTMKHPDRQRIRATFDSKGNLDAICYDQGCDKSL